MLIRIWLALMALITVPTTAPYLLDPAKAALREGIVFTGPAASGSVLIAYGMQGAAMGLYCLWGAIVPARSREAMRFLVLYMACVAVGRAIAAAPFFGQPGSMPMIAFASDTAITLVSAYLLYRDGKAPRTQAAVATA